MNRETSIDEILNQLVKSGSEIEYLKELKERSIELTKKDIGLDETLGSIAKEIKEQTEEFLNQKNQYGTNYIAGISSCIYLPDFNNDGEYKLKLIGGSRSRNKDIKIDESTLFDVASITKLYTLILLFKLEKIGLIDLNTKISDINPDFQNLEDFTLNDLVRLHGELRTNGNITQASSEEEAYEMLKTLYLTSNSREENKYTDFGAMVIGYTIEKVVSEKLGRKLSFEDIMYEYFLSPLRLFQTQFNPSSINVTGNNNKKRLVHDSKARILGGALGHAGIFTTSDDLARLSKEIYRINYIKHKRGLINKTQLNRLGEITFPNSAQSNKGNLGLYVKHPMGYAKTFTPPEFSTGSFSHQGWTGSIATFDPNNLIHNNILVNAIYEDEDKEKVRADKPIGFGTAFEEYQKQITRNIMLMYVAKQYYNRYCNVKENIEVVKYI
ncbi:MAG: beta-lactamase family protein [Bacilli bacterium]|nr:beta-lactamase family protein [Bacilli bacterium]